MRDVLHSRVKRKLAGLSLSSRLRLQFVRLTRSCLSQNDDPTFLQELRPIEFTIQSTHEQTRFDLRGLLIVPRHEMAIELDKGHRRALACDS